MASGLSAPRPALEAGAPPTTTTAAPPAIPQPGPDLQRPPSPRPANVPTLAPLLVDTAGQAITTPQGWRRQREAILAWWQEFMGVFPSQKAPLKSEFLVREELPGFTRQLVRYQVEEDVWTDGWLLVPKPARGKRPGLVVFHPTIQTHTAQVAGLDTTNPEKMQGVQLVQRGYVVFCPRCFIFADGADYLGNVKAMQARHPAWTGMARMTYDAVRAADLLVSLPYVDPNRIGGIGHSLGAKAVLYAAAFDERYRVAVFSEGGIGLGYSNWEAEWYLGPRSKAAGFARDNHQLMALVAPRAFLLLAGESADGDRSWPFVESVLPVYHLLGASERLGWHNHRLGHRYPPAAQAVAEAFLDHYLK
jgi:dienelactone hydrolase